MKKIMFCFAAVLAAFIFAGCSKKPSFTTEEGAAYIRDVFSRKGEDILDTMKGGIGTCRQTPSIISITEEGKTDSHFDKRWYKVTYVAKHASLKQGQRFCVCSEKRETGHVFVNRVKGTYSLGVFQLGGITDVFK